MKKIYLSKRGRSFNTFCGTHILVRFVNAIRPMGVYEGVSEVSRD